MSEIFIRLLFGSMLITNLLWINCSSENDRTPEQERIRVKTAKVYSNVISKPIHTNGRLATKAEMKLSFKIGGIIKHIQVEEGQKVKKGQKLAELDLSEINAQVNQAKSAFEKAERDVTRIKRLYADSAVTLELLQNAETGLEIARSNLNIAEFNLRHATIYAPDDGKILKRFAEVNELVGAGMPVFYFGTTTQEWIVRVGVTDKEILQLQLNDSAYVTFDAYPSTQFPAQITEIAETSDPMSGTFEVELKVSQGKNKFVSGFVAKVTLFSSFKTKYSLIPIEALVEGDGNNGFVFSLAGNKVKRIPVQINFIVGSDIAIESGLENVNEVVTEGVAYLREGDVVEVVR